MAQVVDCLFLTGDELLILSCKKDLATEFEMKTCAIICLRAHLVKATLFTKLHHLVAISTLPLDKIWIMSMDCRLLFMDDWSSWEK